MTKTPMQRAEANGDSLAARLDAWLADAGDAPQRLHPADELLAEHALMRATLAGMQRETQSLRRNGPLRPELWAKVIDVIGNFIHRIHRVKEEAVFFPQLLEAGLIEESDRSALLDDHRHLHDMTVELCDGVSEGDWEKAMRTAARYLDHIGAHLHQEELRLTSPSVRALPPEIESRLREAFDHIEAMGLGTNTRHDYVELARAICKETDIPFAHDGDR